MAFLSRLQGAFARRAASWLGRRTFQLRETAPLVTFTFDDFPRSAWTSGGRVLADQGAVGTYFVAMGLKDTTIATGKMFSDDDLAGVLEGGHELGCHTFHHHPAWETPAGDYEASVERNIAAIAGLARARPPLVHSYPISYPRPATKRRLGRLFAGCRAGGQTFNCGEVDLNYLKSFFIEQSVGDLGKIERTIAENAKAAGWLIFSTHDVTPDHTRYGCSTVFFEQVVKAVKKSGAEIVTMSQALNRLGATETR